MNQRGVLLAMLLPLAALAGCRAAPDDTDRPATAREFPRAYRPVSSAGPNTATSEVQRDKVNEAGQVMDLSRIAPGMTVAGYGLAESNYTVRLAERVGAKGRVLAQDIDRGALARLGSRVERERLENVSIKLGAEDDPRLPANSFDRVFMTDMYHEIAEPYAFLWRMRPALHRDGRVIVVEVDRPTDQHGIPPALLFCEFGAVGFRLAQFVRKPELQGYYAEFEAAGSRPAPAAIKPCRQPGKASEKDSRPSAGDIGKK